MSNDLCRLPDGSAFGVMSFPLPEDHWIYDSSPPPMPFRMGTDDSRRKEWRDKIIAAGRYAVQNATMHGKEMDFDPDALVQNLIIGLLGYNTPDGEEREGD